MKGLIVHEWVEQFGGAEKVLSQFIQEFPDSDLRVLWSDDSSRFENAQESWLAKTALRKNKVIALPFMLPTWRRLQSETDYDWLLVSSHLFAHHSSIPNHRHIPKFVYAHTPARYVWEPNLDVRGNRLPYRIASTVLRKIDKQRAQEISAIATNSNFTKHRIERTWQRESTVIYPPVETKEISSKIDWGQEVGAREEMILSSLPSVFISGASRFVPYKKLEKVIEAGEILDLPVVLIGNGPEEQKLRERANNSTAKVIFVIRPSSQLLWAIFQRSLVYVFPAIEDFGIMPVEAIACGTPIVVPEIGGASEIANLTSSGFTFDLGSRQSFREALDAATLLDTKNISASADIFSNERFRREIRDWHQTNLCHR